MTSIVEIRTGARLHFGLFTTDSEGGPFGGIGMMIDRPGFVLQCCEAEEDNIDCPPELSDRVAQIVGHVRRRVLNRQLRPESRETLPPVAIHVESVIPPHRGFGSGTQFTFAIATAMAAVLDIPSSSLRSERLGRGERSAVGTLGFFEGGFLVDRGACQAPAPGQVVKSYAVPEGWRIVVIDPRGRGGPHGSSEVAGFQSLPAMPRDVTNRLFGLVEESILPGLERVEHDRFARGVAEFNQLVGQHFAPAQGGIYAQPLIRGLVEQLGGTNWPFVAQSSWGPAAAVFCENADSAHGLTEHLNRILPAGAAEVFIARPLNRGAEVVRREADQ